MGCNGCTACCRGDTVEILPHETGAWQSVYKDGRRFLAKREEDGNCVYLAAHGCMIHGQNPQQCQTFNCVTFFKGLTRNERRAREKVFPNASEVWAAARRRIAMGE